MDPNAHQQHHGVRKYWWVPRQRFIQEMINVGNTHEAAQLLASQAPQRPQPNGKPALLLLKGEVEVRQTLVRILRVED
jgi:hypothetical protein